MHERKKYLIILGANLELVDFYLEAKKLGLKIVGMDKNPNSPAFKYADKKIISSTRNAEEALKKIIKFSKKNKIIGITTSAHDVPFTVAKIAKTLHLKSISIKNSLIASNKAKMKNFFFKNKISTSKFFLCKNFKEFNKKSIKLPIIIKPIDGRGSRGVTYHEDLTKIEWALKYARENSNYRRVIVEEFIKGQQFSAEGFVYNKKYHPIALADRDYSNLAITKPFVIENGGRIPSAANKKLESKINKFCSKIVWLLNLESGPIKFDLVINNGKVKCIEFALRLSGGFLSSIQIPKIYNINLMKMTILDSIKRKIPENYFIPKKRGYLVVKYIFANKKGKYVGLKNAKMLKDKEQVFYFKAITKRNTLVDVSKYNASRLATFACYDKNYRLANKKSVLIEKKVKPIIR